MLLGTSVQAYQSAKRIKSEDPSGHRSFVAIDDLSTEYHAFRQPRLWFRRQREIRQLKSESVVEAQEYSRIRWQLLSWVSLVLASLTGLLATVLS